MESPLVLFPKLLVARAVKLQVVGLPGIPVIATVVAFSERLHAVRLPAAKSQLIGVSPVALSLCE